MERIPIKQNKNQKKLGSESLKFRLWFWKLCTFHKIKTTGVPDYLFDFIPETNHIYNTGLSDKVTTFYSRTDVYKYFFFPYKLLEWNKVDKNIQQSKTIKSFRYSLLKISQPIPKPVYNIHKPTGLKLLTKWRLGLSLLNEHKFNHNFRDCVNPLCPCSLEFGSFSHYFSSSLSHIDICKTHFHELNSFDENILNQSDNEIVELWQ